MWLKLNLKTLKVVMDGKPVVHQVVVVAELRHAVSSRVSHVGVRRYVVPPCVFRRQ